MNQKDRATGVPGLSQDDARKVPFAFVGLIAVSALPPVFSSGGNLVMMEVSGTTATGRMSAPSRLLISDSGATRDD